MHTLPRACVYMHTLPRALVLAKAMAHVPCTACTLYLYHIPCILYPVSYLAQGAGEGEGAIEESGVRLLRLDHL